MKNSTYIIFCIYLFVSISCNQQKSDVDKKQIKKKPLGMVWIPGGIYDRGAVKGDTFTRKDEQPKHTVKVSGFWMDVTEVTNKQNKEFVNKTGYITIAERNLDWQKIKKELPKDTPKPHDSILKPGSLSFHCKQHRVNNLDDYSQWWKWKIGANWKHPQGEKSNIDGKENSPVVHIAYEDAQAYCKWAKRRLLTEAEWEYAARGGLKNKIFPWGDDDALLNKNANTWQGVFPTNNTKKDGFEKSTPVKSFPPNDYGLYDMAGNVWEWTQDWYDYNYYELLSKSKLNTNPFGPEKSNNPNNLNATEKTIRGGSFLCHKSYCTSYRVSARIAANTNTGLEYLGFRTVFTPSNKE
jgi:sulfatase modifying factor 1